MMKCPRCGFNQPRDQYCAQCGVDISSYKPPQQPLFQRLLKSNLVQLGLVAVVILVVANYLINKKDTTLTERVNYLKGNLQISSQKPMPSPAPASTTPVAPPSEQAASMEASSAMMATKAATPPAADNAPATPPSASASANLVKSVERSAETAGENKTQHAVKISYYEISKRVRELLFDESRGTGQFNSYGDYTAGILNQFHRRLPSLGKEAVLLYSETKVLGNENVANWFIGGIESGNENPIGFRNILELTEIDQNSFRINFELIKNWKEPAEGNTTAFVKISYPLQVDMLKTSACFIWGILNPNTIVDREDNINTVPPFTILKSRDFRMQQSQLLILIEIEK